MQVDRLGWYVSYTQPIEGGWQRDIYRQIYIKISQCIHYHYKREGIMMIKEEKKKEQKKLWIVGLAPLLSLLCSRLFPDQSVVVIYLSSLLDRPLFLFSFFSSLLISLIRIHTPNPHHQYSSPPLLPSSIPYVSLHLLSSPPSDLLLVFSLNYSTTAHEGQAVIMTSTPKLKLKEVLIMMI